MLRWTIDRLKRARGLDADALEDLVDHRSGLAGVSGVGSDMRELQRAGDDPDAMLAVAMFRRAVQKQIAAMIAVLEGADAIVFTGGIGEHDAATREEICRRLAWLGFGDDGIAVHVVASREDEQIALIAAGLLGAG